ncbi:hypothetical protein OG204_02905 [Streptomyces sp. NBC_01387]|uniref:cupin domain-containing protein n=1 Tax=unclassified Streptomyces TaxID=2593676 RepID=UPI00202422B9|nr:MULTISPECIES: hypothetical protein [unclassified Streptomyces]MCX4552763.1 hypothetical protein [Streptomyces sp. NBC_01500]WSC24101.1 hypothetical protein OIE60_32945 [Streptomyces sp. NBC_01766]
MSSPFAPGVVADTARLVRDAADGQRGALWRLTDPARQLDSNTIRLAPGTGVAGHVEPDLDVLLCVLDGDGQLETAEGQQELRPGTLAWLPRGVRRALTAGPGGLVYLTVHRRRAGLSIASPAGERAGGEAPCLLHRVCPGCGRLTGESEARFCSRCGDELPTG